MSKIQVLSKQTAELIAAGEVVERPASVVKEIMENAIDAGADTITLEIKNGGITFIRVTDNGTGISRDDVKTAFLSHATSKIADAEDLDSISTLGFRGEALASIAAVSRVEMLTRTAQEDLGTRYVIEGGESVLLDDAGCPKGTTLIIRDLFYNTPARMKFLKKDVSEANAAAGIVDRIALSHPEISVRFIRDGKQTLLTPGDGNLKNTIFAVFGKDFASELTKAEYTADGVTVTGFISKPSASRPNRSMQFFFLNGRQIKTLTGSTALSEAYKHAIMTGKFPSCVLNIIVPAESVDVNVHPTKTEVRFVNDKQIFNAIYYAVKNALADDRSKPAFRMPPVTACPTEEKPATPVQMELGRDLPTRAQPPAIRSSIHPSLLDIEVDEDTEEPSRPENTKFKIGAGETPGVYTTDTDSAPSSAVLFGNTPVSVEINPDDPPACALSNTAVPEAETREQEEPPQAWTLIGEAFQTYVLVERGDELLVIDKHAAHERMLFNRLLSQRDKQFAQLLLTPVTVTLNKDEYAAVLENTALLEQAGFVAEDFGAGMIIVRECPMLLDIGAVAEVMMELAGYLLANKKELIAEKLEWLYHSVACRAAIKAGDITTPKELEHFVQTLMHSPDIRHCPHGRPVMISMRKKDFEKNFGRV